jgi:hypothetical protein
MFAFSSWWEHVVFTGSDVYTQHFGNDVGGLYSGSSLLADLEVKKKIS